MTLEEQLVADDWLRLRVVAHDGRNLGRIVAVIHRRGGCDVLVERRRWLRVSVRRLDLADLTRVDHRTYRQAHGTRAATGSGDWSAA